MKFFQINFNDYKSTNNKFLFTVESDGLCEYEMGQDPDLAESFIAWIALRYSKRTSDWDKALIEKKVPNRMKFFDEQQFDMYPLVLNTE